MHNAPSVSYPVGRSLWGAALLALAWLAGAAASVLWATRHETGAARSAVALLAVALTGLLAGWRWWRGPRGTLAWDGAHWTWDAPPGRQAAGMLQVGLDLQSFLLVRWRAGTHEAWLWLERAACPERWDDLRRAVYSRARPEALPVAEPPAAKT